MKKLYVGCRVRILWSYGWPDLSGQQGVIVSPAFEKGLRGQAEWVVKPDCWDNLIAPHPSNMGGEIFSPNSDQLAPIIPEGMQPASWADCLWSPESGFRYDKVTA